jgi:hypothetical protein
MMSLVKDRPQITIRPTWTSDGFTNTSAKYGSHEKKMECWYSILNRHRLGENVVEQSLSGPFGTEHFIRLQIAMPD